MPALEYAQNLQKRAEKVSDLEVENQKLRETLGITNKIEIIHFYVYYLSQRSTITNLPM